MGTPLRSQRVKENQSRRARESQNLKAKVNPRESQALRERLASMKIVAPAKVVSESPKIVWTPPTANCSLHGKKCRHNTSGSSALAPEPEPTLLWVSLLTPRWAMIW